MMVLPACHSETELADKKGYGSRPDPLNPPIRGQKLERPLRKQSSGLFLGRCVDELIAVLHAATSEAGVL